MIARNSRCKKLGFSTFTLLFKGANIAKGVGINITNGRCELLIAKLFNATVCSKDLSAASFLSSPSCFNGFLKPYSIIGKVENLTPDERLRSLEEFATLLHQRITTQYDEIIASGNRDLADRSEGLNLGGSAKIARI